MAFQKFHGLVLLTAVLAGIYLLKYAVACGFFVVRRMFTWSRYTFDNNYLTHTRFGKTIQIDLAKPFEIRYQFLFGECTLLKLPYYYAMVIRQNSVKICILPSHLVPKIDTNDVPLMLRDTWAQYDGKLTWFVLPKWLAKLMHKPAIDTKC